MKKYGEVEQSFHRIRGASNNSDVKDMVIKFFTKEQTYADLLKQVQINEQKFEELKI